MLVTVHTKDNHHYIIDNVDFIDINTPVLNGAPIPEDEETEGFRFVDSEDTKLKHQKKDIIKA